MKRRDFLKLFGSAVVVATVSPEHIIAKTEESVVVKIDTINEKLYILYGDGVHDDTKALQALFDGQKVITKHGDIIQNKQEDNIVYIPNGTYVLDTKE